MARFLRGRSPDLEIPVDIFPMSDLQHDDQETFIFKAIDDPISSHPDAIHVGIT
jgi:hypothetical protein